MISKYNKILFAEDDKNNHVLIKEIIQEELECTVIGYYNGKLLLEEFVKNPNYDLIILDINMPEMTGIDCIKEIRKINKFIPVYALTAFALEKDEEEYLNIGFTGLFPKPLDLDNFLNSIENHLK